MEQLECTGRSRRGRPRKGHCCRVLSIATKNTLVACAARQSDMEGGLTSVVEPERLRESSPGIVVTALRSRLPVERDREGLHSIGEKQTEAACAVRQRSDRSDLTVRVDHRITKVLECCPARCDLIGHKYGQEVPALATEDSKVSGPSAHLSFERHLPSIVDDRITQGCEPAACRCVDVIPRDRDCLCSVGAKDSLCCSRAPHQCQIGDRAAIVGVVPYRRYGAPDGRLIPVLNDRNDFPPVAPENTG